MNLREIRKSYQNLVSWEDSVKTHKDLVMDKIREDHEIKNIMEEYMKTPKTCFNVEEIIPESTSEQEEDLPTTKEAKGSLRKEKEPTSAAWQPASKENELLALYAATNLSQEPLRNFGEEKFKPQVDEAKLRIICWNLRSMNSNP